MLNVFWDNFFKSEKKEIVKFIKNCPLFSELNSREQVFMSKLLHKRSYIEGELVFKPESGTGMYIILKGRVNIFHGSTESEEEANLISVLKEGDFFGELALVQSKCYHNMFARVSEPSQLLGFFKSDLQQLIDHDPKTGVKVLKRLAYIISHRLLKAEQKILQNHAGNKNR